MKKFIPMQISKINFSIAPSDQHPHSMMSSTTTDNIYSNQSAPASTVPLGTILAGGCNGDPLLQTQHNTNRSALRK